MFVSGAESACVVGQSPVCGYLSRVERIVPFTCLQAVKVSQQIPCTVHLAVTGCWSPRDEFSMLRATKHETSAGPAKHCGRADDQKPSGRVMNIGVVGTRRIQFNCTGSLRIIASPLLRVSRALGVLLCGEPAMPDK